MYIYNDLVVNSVTIPESRLKKNHFSICYHSGREAVSGGKVRIGWVPNGSNIAELLTKVLEGPNIRDILIKIIH